MALGEAVQVDPINPVLKVPGTMRLKLKYGKLLSSFAFKSSLRPYTLQLDFSDGLLEGPEAFFTPATSSSTFITLVYSESLTPYDVASKGPGQSPSTWRLWS